MIHANPDNGLFLCLPLLPELWQTGHTEHVQVEADPGKCEDDAQAPQHEAVQLHDPPERGEAGTVKLQDETLLPCSRGGIVVIKILLSFITDGRIFKQSQDKPLGENKVPYQNTDMEERIEPERD